MASAGLIAALHKRVAKSALLRIHSSTSTTVSTARWTLSQPSQTAGGAAALRVQAYPAIRTFFTTTRLAQQRQDGKKDDEPSTPPSTSLGASKPTVDTSAVPDPTENIKSIEDLIHEFNKQSSATQAQLEGATASRTGHPNEDQEGRQQQDHQEDQQQQQQRNWSSWRQSKFWRYLWIVFYWSCLGSLPIHLMMIKNETKTVQEKLEWKIAVLQDMRDKLARGESIEEEEALLAVGMDRSKREMQHQVDDQMFEELIKSAEKLDMDAGNNTKMLISELPQPAVPEVAPTATPAPTPQPTVPRKPTPPKSERSFL
ncbi:hypothetical protein DFQ26_001345 [Actinomortierella ambigua]|nr:hypothetical protein DFQ26_001345 [Actinomortierella ambigua]